MRTALIIAFSAALLAACGKSATVEGEAGKKLTLHVPKSVTVVRGQTEKVDIRVTRKDLPGDVVVSFDRLPAGVEVIDLAQRITGESAVYTLKASPEAEIVEKFQAKVTATGPGGLGVTEPIDVNVKEK
jgi:hypothetical protein